MFFRRTKGKPPHAFLRHNSRLLIEYRDYNKGSRSLILANIQLIFANYISIIFKLLVKC